MATTLRTRLPGYSAALLAVIGLYFSSRYNYLLFHALVEGFAIVITCGIFMFAWNSRGHIENQYLLFIGIAYLFVGVIDLVHTFTYKGMNILPGYDANAPTQLWIAARYLESLTLLIAPLTLRRRINPGYYLVGYGAVTVFILLSVLYWRIFPDCYLEHAGGLTLFKKTSEYIISAILIAAAAWLIRLRGQFDERVLKWLVASMLLTILSELSFTTYASVYGNANLIGHLLKIASFALIYKAIIETGLTKPYDLLFRDLNQQREWLRVTLGSIGDAVVATDTMGCVTFLNAVASNLTGWPEDEALGQPVREILRTINEETRGPADDVVQQVLEQGCGVNMANHTALLRRDGSEIPIEDSAAPIRGADGAIIGAVVVFHDVSEQRSIQRKAEQQRIQLEAAFASMQDGICIADAKGEIAVFNPAFARFHRFHDKTEYLRQFADFSAWFKVFTADGKSLSPDEWMLPRALRGEVEVGGEYIIERSDLKEKWYAEYSFAPIRYESRIEGAVVAMRDITERKKIEEALRRSTAQHELLSATSSRLLATEDPQGLVQELCSQVMNFLDCHTFFNFIADDSAGKLHLNAWAGIPDYEARRIEWLEYGTAVCGCVARDRQRITVENILDTCDLRTELIRTYGIQAYSCHPLLVQDRLIGTLSFGTRTRAAFTDEEVDLMRTVAGQVALAMQRIRTQQELKTVNEALESKVRERTAELASNLKELREANERLNARAVQLRALAGELTMAEQRERKRLAKILHDGLQQHLAAAKLHQGCITYQLPDDGLRKASLEVEEILAESIKISRSLSAELSPPALHEGGIAGGLEWLVRWMREKHNFSVDLDVGHPLELREDIKVLLFESVRELLFNAVKYAKVSRARVRLNTYGDSGVCITVSDDGAGFVPDQLNPAAQIGGGFGLFSIRERVGLIGGSMEIESAPGKGSRFRLMVDNSQPGDRPVSALAGRTLHEECPLQEDPGGRIRILLADDHAIFREGLARLLNREPGMEVVAHAKDALEAIELTRRIKPHVILMDLDMPDISGLEATRIIHQMGLGTRIIGLSMYDERERSREMLRAGAVDYRTKGCAASELVEVIRACVQDNISAAARIS